MRTGIRHGPIRRQHHVFSRRWSRSGRSLDTRPRIPLVIPAALHACDPCTASPPPTRARPPTPHVHALSCLFMACALFTALSHAPAPHAPFGPYALFTALQCLGMCALHSSLTGEVPAPHAPFGPYARLRSRSQPCPPAGVKRAGRCEDALVMACMCARHACVPGTHVCQVFNVHTSHLTPHTSHLTPHASHLIPHTSRFTPPWTREAPRGRQCFGSRAVCQRASSCEW